MTPESREKHMTTPLALEQHASSPAGRAPRISLLGWLCIAGAVAVLALLIHGHMAGHEAVMAEATHDGPPVGYEVPPVWACAPFLALLLCIAVFPLIPSVAHWWEHNVNRLVVSLVLAAITLVFYWFVHPMTYGHVTHQTFTGAGSVAHVLEHAILAEYVPFIVLLFSLYVISGGISLTGDLPAHPRTNVAFLGVGAGLASFIGTTGASMLLIRPLLQTNSERRHVRHTVIFFIFLVSNIGGCLLPIGDPPLFLGYLKGVPFLWTFGLFLPWAVTCILVLSVYYLWDRIAYRHESVQAIAADETLRMPLRLAGTINLWWLVGVVLCVALIDPEKELLGLGVKPFPFMREFLQLGFVALSLRTTPNGIRGRNQFNYHAILEVAALFIGIFICMQVPIEILNAKGAALGLTRPWHFFWATGSLSSFLDNAPTYVVFFETANSMTHQAGPGILELMGGAFVNERLLVGISLGAVFMGAMTYIGNGPNFMVKSIAEQSGIKMPSFFGYLGYSVVILVPVLILVTLIFVR